MTTPAGRDSLLIAGEIELLGGGVPSTHPACPGAVFRLGREYDLGAAQPAADVVAKLLQGGSRPYGRWADNRTVVLPVVILGPDRAIIVAARELLAMLTDAQRYEVRWTRAGAPGPLVLDAFRADPSLPGYSVIEERQGYCQIEITFQALPYGRSDVRTEIGFGPDDIIRPPDSPAPGYAPWMPVDDYTNPAWQSETQTAFWTRRERPGTAPWPWSVKWNPEPAGGGGEINGTTPVCHRILPAPLDISGRQHLNVWVGLGNSRGRWRGGNLTIRVTLYGATGLGASFGGTYRLYASDDFDKPTFTRISIPMPIAPGVYGGLAEYIVEVPNFYGATQAMGDLYLHLLGVAPSAELWPPASETPASPRAGVYVLKSIGTARAPMSLVAQAKPHLFRIQESFDQAGGYAWVPPDDLIGAPDGTADSVLVGVWGGGGPGGSRTQNTDEVGGGNPYGVSASGCGGGFIGHLHYPVTKGQQVQPFIVGAGGPPGTDNVPGQPAGMAPVGGVSQFGTLTATGGEGGARNSFHRRQTPDPASVETVPGNGIAEPGTPGVEGTDWWRHPGGNSAVGVGFGSGQAPAGAAEEGSGGGGGGAGSSGPGIAGGNVPNRGRSGGAGGPGSGAGAGLGSNAGMPGGGGGGGGRGVYAQSPPALGPTPGAGSPGGRPGGAGGGAVCQYGWGGRVYGAPGGSGRITVQYMREKIPLRRVLLHMPNPDSAATFVPVVNVGDGLLPPDGGGNQFIPASPHPGMAVKYDGTYTIALTAAAWDVAAYPGRRRRLAVTIRQMSRDTGFIAEQTLALENFHPLDDWRMFEGVVIMGNITLPLRWIPPDNQVTYWVITVDSRWYPGSGGNSNETTGDRFLDCLILDVTGQTVGLIDRGGGHTSWYFDEPESGLALGGITGSSTGRTGAVSATQDLVACSGGPFTLEPGAGNMLLAYSADYDPSSVDPGRPSEIVFLGPPALAVNYYPRWWFDRADDQLDRTPFTAATRPLGVPPPSPALTRGDSR